MVTEATVTDERLTTHRSSEVGGISRHQQMSVCVVSYQDSSQLTSLNNW